KASPPPPLRSLNCCRRGDGELAKELENAGLTDGDKLARIGVLAIQGDYQAHAEALSESGAEPIEVRKPDQLASLHGLILPGGESTTVLRFLDRFHLFDPFAEFCRTKPVFGTCAGAILL